MTKAATPCFMPIIPSSLSTIRLYTRRQSVGLRASDLHTTIMHGVAEAVDQCAPLGGYVEDVQPTWPTPC